MGPPVENGLRPYVRHCSDCSAQTGFVKKVENGEPLYDGAVLLESRPGEPGAFNVLSTYKAEKSGPAQVATKDYRDGWDRIFGGSTVVGQA